MRQVDILRSWAVAAVGACLVPMFSGCVAYQKHKELGNELERTQQALRDMTAQYNKLYAMRGAAIPGRAVVGVPQSEHDKLKAQLADLRRQLADQQLKLSFEKEDVTPIEKAELEDGGIRLGEALLFNEGVAALKSSELPALDQLVQLLRTKYPGEAIIIEGHTDNQPLVRTKKLHDSNLKLSFERAYSVFKYLQDHGIPEDLMRVEAFADGKPIDPATENTEEGRRLNRRVVIRRGGAKI
jgi:chemotaxis protein MotB